MKLIKTRKGIVASMAVAMGLGAVGFVSAPTAIAGSSKTCSAQTVTINTSDSQNGALLPNTSYIINTDGSNTGNYLMVGDQKAKEASFYNAFIKNYTGTKEQLLSSTPFGQDVTAAFQQNLGITRMPLPQDITSITDPSVQATALTQWQSDPNSTILNFKTDTQRRLNAINKVVADLSASGFTNDAYYTYASGEAAKLQNVVDNINTATTTNDWNTFVNAYNNIIDPDNWVYGLNHTPTLFTLYTINPIYILDFENWVLGNQVAASTVGAGESITVKTDANGNATFTIFGAPIMWENAETPGSANCTQFASVTQSQAANGYILDPTVRNFSVLADPAAVNTLAITNDPYNQVDPTPPVFTDTGVKGQERVATRKQNFSESIKRGAILPKNNSLNLSTKF